MTPPRPPAVTDPHPTPDNVEHLHPRYEGPLVVRVDVRDRIDALIDDRRKTHTVAIEARDAAFGARSEAGLARAAASRAEAAAVAVAADFAAFRTETGHHLADISAAIIRRDASDHEREKRKAATTGAAKGAGGVVGLGGVAYAVAEVLERLPPVLAISATVGLLLLVALVLWLRRPRS